MYWDGEDAWFEAEVLSYDAKAQHLACVHYVVDAQEIDEDLLGQPDSWRYKEHHVKGRVATSVEGSRVVVTYEVDQHDGQGEVPRGYAGLVIAYVAPDVVGQEPGLLVRFDGMKKGDEGAECMVDEDGEDDWCWGRSLRASSPTRRKREQNTARETMYLVASPWEDGWEHWKPYRELRPNWVWSGIDEGWQQNASEVWQLAYDVKAKGKKAEELEDDDLLTDHGARRSESEEEGEAAGGVPEGGEGMEEEELPEVDGEADGGEADGEAGAVGEAMLVENAQRPDSTASELAAAAEEEEERPRNVILGDEMGLGKTAQRRSRYCSRCATSRRTSREPFLIVAPLSTLLRPLGARARRCGPTCTRSSFHGRRGRSRASRAVPHPRARLEAFARGRRWRGGGRAKRQGSAIGRL